jgi:hypothetical protein
MKSDLFVVHDLKPLMQHQGQCCVSIFMPAQQVTARVQENHIRFKNLLREAETRLAEMKAESMDTVLESAYRLLEDRPFWHHQSEGMALFMSKGFFKPYRLPIDLDELVVVGDRFHVKPVLQLLTGDGTFYLLALSQNEVRLFQCSRHSISQMDLEGAPLSVDEAMKYEESEKQLQFRASTRTAGSSGKRPPLFHGHGDGAYDYKDRILRFLQDLDRGLTKTIPDPRAPLVLAAVDYLAPIFREASAYPTIMDEIIPGNPEGVLGQDLLAQASDIIVPYFKREMKERVDRYWQLIGTGKAANVVEEVVKAAYHGRVDVLFVSLGVHRWGTYDPSRDEVVSRKYDEQPGWDLLDFAAVQTLLNSGVVYALKPEDMPDKSPVAAVLRY